MLVYKGEHRTLADGVHSLKPGQAANVVPFAMLGSSGFKAMVILEPKHDKDYVSGKTGVRYLFSCNIEYEHIEDFINDWEVFDENDEPAGGGDDRAEAVGKQRA